MATHIVVSNNDYTNIDDSYIIKWADKGNAMPALENTVHYILWTSGQKEIQTKVADSDPPEMAGNIVLSDVSDSVGSTTIQELLTWSETRKSQILEAVMDYDNAFENAGIAWVDAGNSIETFNDVEAPLAWDWNKTWIDYDPNYS
jgi:hypothetical protein